MMLERNIQPNNQNVTSHTPEMDLNDKYATVDLRKKNDDIRPDSDLTCFSPLFLNNKLDVYEANNNTADQIKRPSPKHEKE